MRQRMYLVLVLKQKQVQRLKIHRWVHLNDNSTNIPIIGQIVNSNISRINVNGSYHKHYFPLKYILL